MSLLITQPLTLWQEFRQCVYPRWNSTLTDKMESSVTCGGLKMVSQLITSLQFANASESSSMSGLLLSITQWNRMAPRSPDLTPCDFFLWGYLKDKVFVTPPRNLQDLQQRIEHEVEVLRQNPGTIRRAVNDMRRRCQLCVERGGGHVEGIGQWRKWNMFWKCPECTKGIKFQRKRYESVLILLHIRVSHLQKVTQTSTQCCSVVRNWKFMNEVSSESICCLLLGETKLSAVICTVLPRWQC